MRADQFAETLRSWRGLYKAALFETDASRLPLRIEEARRALVFRSRELFAASPSYDDEDRGYRECPLCSPRIGELFEIEHKRSQARSASLLEFCHTVSDGEVLP